MRSRLALLVGAVGGFVALCPGPTALAASQTPCAGIMRVSPAIVHVGGTLTISGDRYTCRYPSGRLAVPTIFLYRPSVGFAAFTASVRPGGTYTLRVRIPQRLTAMSSINGVHRMVATAPGRYFLSISLFDVSMPPPARSLANVKIVR